MDLNYHLARRRKEIRRMKNLGLDLETRSKQEEKDDWKRFLDNPETESELIQKQVLEICDADGDEN
jgi:hypothetical protein